MSLTYAQYVTTIANLMVTTESNAEFTQILPSIIADAEQRIYRELDLLTTVTRDTSSHLNSSNRNFTLPSSIGTFVVTQEINVLSPAGTTVSNGTRNSLTPVSLAWLDYAWPSNSPPASNTVPVYFAMVTDQQIAVGPAPGQDFNVEVVGTIRPAPLSSTNTSTYLSQYLPDLFVSASMVFASAFMRNFGSQADDPKMATSWESHYQDELKSAMTEEYRKKWQSQGWTSQSPSPIASPPRQ